MTFKDWAISKKLVEEATSNKEIRDLLDLADQKIADCEKIAKCDVSPETHHEIVYMALLPSAKAVLRANGYRTNKDTIAGHDVLIQGLSFTVYPKDKDLIPFQTARKIRQQTAYSSMSDAQLDVKDLFDKVKKLRKDSEGWIRRNFAHLLEP